MNVLISLTVLGTLAMFGGIFRYRNLVMPITVLGLVGALLLDLYSWGTDQSFFNNMMRMDNFAIAFTAVCILGALFTVLFYHFFHSLEESHYSEVFALILFSLAGAVVMVSFTNLLMLFLGLEILSLSFYVLSGVRKKDLLSNESSLKYFLMGAFSTGFLLFGIALIYGATGSFDTEQIADQVTLLGNNSLLIIGLMLIMIGLLFKVSAVPFQFWTPDVYQGAPTIITGYMATVGKVAAFAAFLRLFQLCFVTLKDSHQEILWVVAVVTMLLGNIIAIYQSSIKRMLAYSSIAHAGYMLIGLVALNSSSSSSILFYSIAYTLASLSSFVIVEVIQQNRHNDRVEDFHGIAKLNPWLAFTLVIAMLSLSGIPFTAGFFGKFYIFSSAIADQFIWLIVFAVISSVISIYYYFRPVIAAYRLKRNNEVIEVPATVLILLIILSFLTILLGVFPGLITGTL